VTCSNFIEDNYCNLLLLLLLLLYLIVAIARRRRPQVGVSRIDHSLKARALIPLGAKSSSLAAAAVVRRVRQRRYAEPRRTGFDLQRPGVQFVLVHQ